MSDNIDYSKEEAVRRAVVEGSMFLNEVFRFDNKTRRIFGKKGPRVTTIEMVWSVISALVVAVVLFPFNQLFGFNMWSPFHTFYYLMYIGLALIFGRRIANMSPLKKKTGEGTGTWFAIAFRKAILRITYFFPFVRPTMYNRYLSYVNVDETKEVDCIEWIGTMRAPRMPYIYDPNNLGAKNEVNLYPRGIRVPLPRRGEEDEVSL